MASSNRELAVTDLVTALRGIDGTGVFTSDIGNRVRYGFLEPEEIPGNEFPMISWEDGDEQYEPHGGRTYHGNFVIALRYYALNRSSEAGDIVPPVWTDVNNLYDDIFHAVHIDFARGGQAYNTVIQRVSGIIVLDDGYALQQMNLVIKYERNETVTA